MAPGDLAAHVDDAVGERLEFDVSLEYLADKWAELLGGGFDATRQLILRHLLEILAIDQLD